MSIDAHDDIDIDDLLSDPRIDNQELLDRLTETDNPDLIPISPEEAKERYLQRRSNELAESSLDTHRSSLNHFVKWCEKVGIDNLNQLNGRKIQDYLDWRARDAPTTVDELAPKSEKTQIDITRKFIEISVALQAVPAGLDEKIPTFRVSQSDEVCDEMLDMGRIDEILDYLGEYHYASRDHVIWYLLGKKGLRLCAVRCLDVEDFSRENESLRLRHRPDEGTSLKNESKSERMVPLVEDDAAELIQHYIDTKRCDVTDEYGRNPLIATRKGRASPTTIRKVAYQWSCPKEIGKDCTHDDDISSSERWTCPNNVSPHPIRSGYITHLLRNDVPMNTVSKACDVSPRVIKAHYDGRTEEEHMNCMRQQMEDSLSH